MDFRKAGVTINRVMAMTSVVVLSISCGPAEQGYWTKPGNSHALTNEQFPTDSQYCQRVAAKDGDGDSKKSKEQIYTRCMYARGYEWIAEKSRPSASDQSASAVSCPTGRRFIDAFGRTKCVPVGTKDGRPNPEVRQAVTSEDAFSARGENAFSDAPRQRNQRWLEEDRDCRQQADATLSNPYGVYAICMQDKRLPSTHP
jgi:hypothetical protein